LRRFESEIEGDAKQAGGFMLKRSIVLAFAGLAITTLAAGGVALAQTLPTAVTQTQGLKRIPLQKFDVPPGEREAVVAVVEIAANSDVARHTHPGPETNYILEGELTLNVEGQPPKMLKPGDSAYVPAGTPHAARTGPTGAKLLVVYIVEKGKPLATPTP
jgi:quercetin dioxygenase-like cupin family protein